MLFSLIRQNFWQFNCVNLQRRTDGQKSPYEYNYLLLLNTPDQAKILLRRLFDSEYIESMVPTAINVLNSRAIKISCETELSLNEMAGADWEFCRSALTQFSMPKLATFDMDSTLIEQEVIDEIAREAGCYQNVAKITEAAMRGELDFSQSLVQRVACLRGLSEKKLNKISERLTFSVGTEKLVEYFHRHNVKTAILSGGFDFFAKRVAKKLNIEVVFANQLEISKGYLTGNIIGDIVDADAKAHHLNSMAHLHSINLKNTLAVGDGANDLKVLEKAGVGVAWHAKPRVAEKADLAINKLGLESLCWLFE